MSLPLHGRLGRSTCPLQGRLDDTPVGDGPDPIGDMWEVNTVKVVDEEHDEARASEETDGQSA
jgi:hypothetical protein